MTEPVVIQKRRKPVWLALLLLLALGVGAEWLFFKVLFPRMTGFWDFQLTAAVAVAAVVLFACGLVLQQASRKKPGLVIDDQGITDNSNFLAVGFIPKKDILSIKEASGDFNRPMVVVMLVNPDEYVNKKPRYVESLRYLRNHFGSPVVINPVNLEIDAQMLLTLLQDRMMGMVK